MWWRHAAPTLLAVSLLMLAAVLLVSDPVNGARRWVTIGPVTFQPSEPAKLALAVWVAAFLSRTRTRPPRTLSELAKPLGLVAGLSCALILLEPDLGTAVAITLMLGGMLVAAGTPLGLLARAGGHRGRARRRRHLARAVPARAHSFFLQPVERRAGVGLPVGSGDDRSRVGGRLRQGHRREHQQDLLSTGGSHGHDLRRHRRGTGADRSGGCDRRVRRLLLGRLPDRALVPRPLRLAARYRPDGAHRRPGCDEPRGRARACSGHRDHAAVPVLRGVEPRRRARCCGHSP